MIFIRRNIQNSSLTINNNDDSKSNDDSHNSSNNNHTSQCTITPIATDAINITDNENKLTTTRTNVLSTYKSTISSNNVSLKIMTSTRDHLARKHPGLLRLFDSTICTVALVVSYLFHSKESIIQQFLGRKLFEYSNTEVDFYLPQLLNMYIHIKSIATVIHDYITTR